MAFLYNMDIDKMNRDAQNRLHERAEALDKEPKTQRDPEGYYAETRQRHEQGQTALKAKIEQMGQEALADNAKDVEARERATHALKETGLLHDALSAALSGKALLEGLTEAGKDKQLLDDVQGHNPIRIPIVDGHFTGNADRVMQERKQKMIEVASGRSK